MRDERLRRAAKPRAAAALGAVPRAGVSGGVAVGVDRGVLRWRFDWQGDDGTPGHVRGVDVLRFRDGLVSEKLSYVKG